MQEARIASSDWRVVVRQLSIRLSPQTQIIVRPPITGTTVLTLRDQVDYQFWDLLRRAPKIAIGMLIVALVANTIGVLLVFGPG